MKKELGPAPKRKRSKNQDVKYKGHIEFHSLLV